MASRIYSPRNRPDLTNTEALFVPCGSSTCVEFMGEEWTAGSCFSPDDDNLKSPPIRSASLFVQFKEYQAKIIVSYKYAPQPKCYRQLPHRYRDSQTHG